MRRRRRPAGVPALAAAPEALPFLDPIDRICAERPPPLLRTTHLLVALLFAALLLVAGLVRVDVVVTGSGRLVTDTPPIVLQPLERGILREMRVQPGETVSRGEVLATLDPTFARADQDAATAQLRALRAQLQRLQAEAAGGAPDFAEPEQPDAALQLSLWQARRAEYASRTRVFDEDLERLRTNLHGAEESRAALAHQLEVTRAVEAMRETLLAQRTGSRLQYLEAVGARMRVERELSDAANRLPELAHGVRSRAAEREGFLEAWRRDLSESLVTTRAEIARLTEAAAKAARLSDLVVVTAPEDGVVLDVAPRSGGSVLREAEPLVTITPSHATLIAEIGIGSPDVGFLRSGAPVEVKIDAYPYQRHGSLHGRLLSVGEDSRPAAAGGEALHRGRVALPSLRLREVPAGSVLYPGLTVTAEIAVGTRSALSYFLTPITRGLQESLREP